MERKNFKECEEMLKAKTGESFDFMYNKYYPRLTYYINGICNDIQKSEDLSTDAFMTAMEKIHMYDEEKAQFSTWLFTIARNLAYQDKKKSALTMSMDVEYDSEGTTMKNFISGLQDIYDSDSEEYYQIQSHKADIIKKHLEDLKEPYKTVLRMREIEGMRYKDIAAVLDRNLSTVKSQIRNGRSILIDRSKEEFSKIDEVL